MESVTIDGVEYIKASVLAKRYRYTADYIGQLCRGRKVDAKLVGRTWYVNTLSLDSHKQTRHKKNEAEKTINNNTKKAKSRLDAQAVEARKPARPIQNPSHNPEANQKNFARRIDWKPLRYEVDNQELLPNLRPSIKKEGTIKINLAEATNLDIETHERPTKFISSDLPIVSLSGRLKVSSLDTDLLIESDSVANDISIDKALNLEYKNEAIKPTLRSNPSLRSAEGLAHTHRVVIRRAPEVVDESVLTTSTGRVTKIGARQSVVSPQLASLPDYHPSSQFEPDPLQVEAKRAGWLEWGLRIFLVFALLLLVAVAILERSVLATSQTFDTTFQTDFLLTKLR